MLPSWLVKKIPKKDNIVRLRELIKDPSVHTVCESARCPNIGECYSRNTMTFMILGDICTRNCGFCAVASGWPQEVDPKEPQKVALAAKKLGLSYIVVTSVTRDDLSDGGALQFAKTVRELQGYIDGCKVEVLIPDFQGKKGPLQTVLNAGPYVLNHNVETVPRLYPEVRPQADYCRSLNLLKNAKEFKKDIYTKSGFMVGLGETKQEVFRILQELKDVEVDFVTIGQYLAPSRAHLKVTRYVHPDEFKEYEEFGREIGMAVFSGPLVRSSFQAAELVKTGI